MKKNIDKYQRGGVISSTDPNVNLATNQQGVISPEDQSFLDSVFNSASNTNNDISPQDSVFLQQAFGDSNQSQDPISQVGPIGTPDAVDPFNNFMDSAKESLNQPSTFHGKPIDAANEDYNQHLNYIQQAMDAGINIPDNTDIFSIKIEDAGIGYAGSNTGYLGNNFFDKDKYAGGPADSNLKRIILPNGQDYIFAPSGHTTGADKMYDLATNAKESLTLGLTQGLEFTNQLLWKFSGLDAAMQIAGKDPAKEGYVNRTQGLFFAPFSNSLRKEIDAEKVKITPDEAYTENERLLAEKMANGDVESLWTEPMYWKKVLSEKSFHENFLPGLESVGEFMVPVMGAGKLKAGAKTLELAMDAGTIGKASWIGKNAKAAGAITDEFLVAAYSGSSEAHLEGMTNGGDIAVQKYNQLLGEDNQQYAINTLDELYAAPESDVKKQALETFDKAYSDIFRANQIPLIISNFLPAHVIMGGKSIFKGVGGAVERFAVKNPVKTALFGFTVQSANEFMEEGYQSGVQNYETDKLLNGLYPMDNNTFEDIAGSWNRFTKDIGHDENTTTSALLGLVLGGGMGMFSEGAAAIKQIKNNNETRELLQAHPIGQLGSIRGLFKDGQVDNAELAKKVNAINSLVVNERFMEEAQKMNNQELMDYAYKQSVSGIIYEAMEKGIDESTVKTHLRGVLDKYTPKDKTFTDANGKIVKPSEFLDQRQKQFDEVIKNYEITNEIATKHGIEGKTKQSLFEAIIGYTSFKKIDEKFRSELKTLETETKAHNELLKQRQQEVKDAQARGKDTFTPNVEDAISSYVDDYFENTKLNRDTRNELVKKINETTGVLNFYSKLVDKLTDSTVSKDQRSLEKRNKIKNLIDRKIRESVERKGDTVNPVPSEDLPEVIAREVKAEDPASSLEDTKREVTRQLDPALKAKEEALAVELWQDSERDGISYNELLNPTGKTLSDQELDVRKNLLAKVLAKQRKDASKVDPEYRYDGRGLLKDVETKGAKEIATSGSPDVLNRIADRFLELKGMSPGARGTFTNFLAAPPEARLQDEIYLQAARDIYSEDLNTTEVPTGKTSTGEEDYGPILGEPTIPILTPGFTESVEEEIPGNEQEEEVQKQKEEDAHTDLNRGLVEGELPQTPDVATYEDISATERARRNKNMIVVAHKQGLSPVEREKAPLRYTRTVDQWELGIGLIHSGELAPGAIIQLEVDPEVGSNKFGNPSWEALNVQAVTYVNGERVVIGQLQPYRQNYLNPISNEIVQGSATPELEAMRKGIHKQWLAEKSSNSVIKTGYETTIKEIYKGNIDQKTARKGQSEYDLPSTQEALSGSGISINDVEIGMVTGPQSNQVPISTNKVRFTIDSNRNTKDPTTRTGFIAVLIKSHKVFKDKSPHYETFGLYTRRVDDVKGYKEKIIELINSNNKSLVKDLVNFQVENAQGEKVSGIQWDYTGEHPLTLNGITIPAYTSYKKIGNQIIQGGEDLYLALGFGNKPVNIDSEWVTKYSATNNKVTHPVFGDPNDGNRIDLKDLVFKHLTKSGIISESLNTYKWNGNMYKSLFHSGGFSVEPFAKPTVPIEGGTIRDVNSPEDFQDEDEDDEPTIRTNRRYKIEDQLTMPPDVVWENQKESEKWFKARLAEVGYTVSDDAIKKLHNLLGLKESAKVWGVAQNAAVTLASLRPEGTTRHEAFHIVFNLFLTKPQRDAAFREAFYKFRPELEKKLGREVSKEEFETELKNDLFGSKGEAKFSLSDNLLSYIDNFNRRLSESNLPANLKRGLKISTNEYLPKKMKPEPRGKRDPLRGVMPQDDLNKFNDTSAVGLLNAALDQINNYISAEQRAINSLISIEHSIANNIGGAANKASLKGSEKITPFNQGNKFNLTSKYIEILKARGNDKIQLDKPFSAPGVSSQEKEVLKKFYDSYIVQLEEFFKSKNKPVPKSIDASRLLNKYKDWLHENYPILHYESQKQIHTYGLSSGITEHPDNKDLKQGWEVNISSGFLKRTGSHTYNLSYTDDVGKVLDVPGKWDTLGWYIYHELYGDTPLFYEFQSDIIDMDDKQLEKLFDSSLAPPKDADGYSIYHKFIDTIRSFEERAYHELDTIEDILKDSNYGIKSKEHLRKVINKKVGEIVKYKVERALRYKKLNDSSKDIDSLIEEEKNLIELAEKEIVSLLSIKYHFNNSAIKLPRRKYFGVRRALENLLKYTATPNITYPTSADKFKYDRSSFDSEVYKDTVLKYLNPVEFENYINYIQDYKDYLREKNNGYDPRDLSVDFDAFSGEAAEIYFNSIKLKGNNEVAQVNTGRITFVDQGNGRKKKQQETISVDDAIAKSKKKIKDSEFRIYNYTNQKKNPIITNFLDEYSKLQEERIKEFVNKQINDLPIPDIDFEKVLTNISTRVDKVKKELSRASNIEVNNLIDKINNPQKDVSSDSDIKKKLLEDVRGLKSHQLKLFITHAITYAKEKGHTKVYFPTADFINKVESGDPWTLYTTPEDQLSGKNKFKESHIGSFYEALMEIPNIKYNYVKPPGVNAHVLEIDISDINVGGVERFSIGTEDGSIDESAEDVYKQQGIMTMLEEFMADEFQYLKETNGLFSEGFKENYPKLAKFLQDLYNFMFKNYNILQQYFSDTRSLDQLYRQIDNNSLGRNFLGQRRQSFTEVLNQNVARRVQENSTGANYKITSIPMARISQRISAINRDIINEIMLNDPMFRDSEGKIRTLYDYISKTSTGKPVNNPAKESIVLLKNVYSKVKDKLDERIAIFEKDLQKAKDRNRPKNIPYYENSIKKLQTMRDLISLDFFDNSKALFGTEEFDFTKRLISELRHSQGIVFKGKVLISHEQLQKKREELEKEASEGFDNSENSESKGEENGGQITQDEWDTYESWQVDVLAENSYEKLSPKLKAEISTIPLMEDVKDPKTGAVVRIPQVDDLGFTIYTNAVKVFDLLVDTISSSANINIMMAKINNLKNKHEIIDHIMGKIETYDGNRVESLKKDLFLSIGNKYKVKHLVNLSATMRGTTGSYESVRVFESARAAIEENIRATFKSNFDQVNWDLINNVPKDRIGKAGKFEGYTYEEFQNLLEVEDPVDRNENLPDVLAAFGFQVTDSIRDYISNNVSQKNEEIYAHIQYMFNRMKEEIPVNPTNFMNDSGKGGSRTRIKDIAKILRYADLNVDMKTFLNVKNKLVSGHVQAGFILKLFNRLKEDIIDNEDAISKEQALDNFNKENTDVFFRKSAILSWLNQGKDIDLTVAYMDGRKRNNVQEGEEITDMGEAIMHINKFEFWIGGMVTEGQKNTKFDYDWTGGSNGKFKNSWYNIAVFDSPKTYFTKLPVFEKIEDVFTYGLQHVYEQERDRIDTLNKKFEADPNYTTGNKELDDNGRRFQFFPELNSTMPMSWELAKPTIERAMASHYDNYINILEGHGLIKRHENKDPNTGIVTKTIIPTNKMTAANIKGKTFEESLKLFFYNDTLMTTQTISLLSGDPASYPKNKLNDLTSTAYQKRNKQLHANGNYGAFENPTYKAIYLKDIKVESKENFLKDITGLMESQGFKGNALKIIVDGYRKDVDPETGKVSYPHNTTDAQGYITLERWKDVLTAFNEWTDKHDAMYERLKDGNATDEDLFLVSQPLKPHYFGFQKLEDRNGDKDFKTPLQHKYSAVVIHPMLTKSNPSLKKLADKMKFHGVDEAIFESGVKVGLTNLMSIEDFIDGDFHETVSKINIVENQYYKQQQKVPAHYLGTVSNLLGVQVRKILPANMNLNTVYATSKSHPELAMLHATLVGEYKDNLYGGDLLRLIDKLQSDNIEKDLSKLVARIMDVPDKDSKGNPVSEAQREKIRRDNVRNILLDAINDKDLNSNHEDAIEVGADGNFKLPLSFPTIARKTEEIFNSLFKKVSKQTHNGGSFVNMSSYGFDDDLSIKIDPVTKEFYVEVALPANNKLLGKNIKTGEIEKIQEGIVYRIPTEEKYSMFPIRVVKWLDPSVGGVIAMPREITSIAGLDFDIDKVYAMFYNHDYDDKTGLISVPRSPATREGRENLLLDAYRAILQNANSAKDALRPQSVQELKDIRKELGRVSIKERPIHLPQSQVKFLVRNQAGKNLIGIVANHNSFHSLANNAGVKLNDKLLSDILTGSLAKYKGIITGRLDGTDVLTTKNVPPVQISRNFAMLLSAAVDNAKDPILDDLNINIFTMPVLGLLLHMGIDMNTAINRINEADFLAASKAFELDGATEALAVSDDIKVLHNAAKALSRVISALRVDSGTGPTFHDVDKKINDIEKVFSDTTAIDTGNLFPEISKIDGRFVILNEGLNNLVPESIKSYIRVFLQEANFAKIDYPYFNQEFEDNKKYLENFKPHWITMSANNRRLADTEHQAILHYSLFKLDGKTPQDFLIEFPAEFSKFAAEYNASDPNGAYGDLFKPFNVDEKTGEVGLLDKNSLDKQAQQDIRDKWESALFDESGTEEAIKIKKMAENLITYGFMLDGYSFTKRSYMHLVPVNFFAGEGKEGFKKFNMSEGMNLNHIGLFTALNNPFAFIPRFYDADFTHTNPKHLKDSLLWKTEGNNNYYLPAYAKQEYINNEPTWVIYLNNEFVNSNYNKNKYLEDPKYTQMTWKDTRFTGRVFEVNDFNTLSDPTRNTADIPQPVKVDEKTAADNDLENIASTNEGMLKDTFTEQEAKEGLDKLDDSITKDLEDC